MIYVQLFNTNIPIFRIIILILIYLTNGSRLNAQDKINFDYDNIRLRYALLNLIENHNVPVVFPDSIPPQYISSYCNNCDFDEAISRLLLQTKLRWEKSNNQYIIILSSMSEKYSVSGRVIDNLTKEPIPYANIFIKSLQNGDISNQDGVFSIKNIPNRTCSLLVSYIGYEPNIIELVFPRDEKKFQTLSLNPKILSAKEVSITGNNREFMERSNNPGQISFSPRHVSTLPNLGEVDIFRSLQFLPGIQLAIGGTSDLYIRGGTPDQNLILLDGMPIYHSGHMFGFISAIPADGIKDIQIYSGAIPAKYGGRISSVIHLISKSGSSLNSKVTIGANLMSQGISIELPINKRGSWILNYRGSNPVTKYSNLYSSIQNFAMGDDKFNLLTETANIIKEQNASYDINTSYLDILSRFSLLLNPKQRVTISTIYGADSTYENRNYFGFNSILGHDTIKIDAGANFRNAGLVLNWYSNWNHSNNTHFSLSWYGIQSYYLSENSILLNQNIYTPIAETIEDNLFSDIHFKLNHGFKGIKNRNLLAGIEHKSLNTLFNTSNTDGTSKNISSLEQNETISSIFFQDSWKISSVLDFQSGIRINDFSANKYLITEPRFALKYKFKNSVTIESSIDKHHQFIHRLSDKNNTRGTQNMWLVSTKNIPYCQSYNYHVGMHLDEINYSFSLSGYNSQIKRLPQFIDSFSFNDSLNMLTSKLCMGSGYKNGLEFIYRKKQGLISGWISYHLNQTRYDFPEINNGEKYLANHDKKHELKAVIISKIYNFDITANWVFSSGSLYTDLENMYVEAGSGFNIVVLENQNGKRLPSVHHMDISLSRKVKIASKIVDLGLSIYNIYNRKNISHKRYNPFSQNLVVTNVPMFGITPNAFFKISF